jgi:phosphatidylglycerol---prolipoprotein diacylglyceryl transferase
MVRDGARAPPHHEAVEIAHHFSQSSIRAGLNHIIIGGMSGASLHAILDIAAWLAAGAAGWWLQRFQRAQLHAPPFPSQSFELPYVAALLFGAGIGAYLFGTLNLWLSGMSGIARSVEGALAGGIFAIELYKWRAGITARTGARFALPLAVGIAVGRLGCYFAGLDDFTYGTPTSLPWGHDFGDGILRHPVQLYESLAMAAFALFYVGAVLRRTDFIVSNGFFLVLVYYGLQRFIWEFIKPYGALIGPLSLFHLLSLAILLYAVVMLATAPTTRLKHERADKRAVA